MQDKLTSKQPFIEIPARGRYLEQVRNQCSDLFSELSKTYGLYSSQNEQDRQEAQAQLLQLGNEIQSSVGANNFRVFLRERSREIVRIRINEEDTAT